MKYKTQVIAIKRAYRYKDAALLHIAKKRRTYTIFKEGAKYGKIDT